MLGVTAQNVNNVNDEHVNGGTTVLTDTSSRIMGFCSFNAHAVRQGLNSNCFQIILNVRRKVFRAFYARPLRCGVASTPSFRNHFIQTLTVHSLTPTKLYFFFFFTDFLVLWRLIIDTIYSFVNL